MHNDFDEFSWKNVFSVDSYLPIGASNSAVAYEKHFFFCSFPLFLSLTSNSVSNEKASEVKEKSMVIYIFELQ